MKRFKTEEEFIAEFGKDFYVKASWNEDGNMDYLFGIEIPENLDEVEITEYLDSKFPKLDNNWYFFPLHFTDKPLPTRIQSNIEDVKQASFSLPISYDINLGDLLRQKHNEGFDAAVNYLKSKNPNLKL